MLRMSTFSRRDVCQSLPLLALLPSLNALAQTPAAAPKPETPAKSDCTPLPICQGIPSVPGKPMKDGKGGHEILSGHIPGIVNIELHETKLDPGKAPHPPHQHPHAELILVREGTLEFATDNPPVTIGPGGSIYCAPNKMHGVHNNGDVMAVYFVVEIGREPPCPN